MQTLQRKKVKLEDIKRLDNYRDFKTVWVYTPCMDNNLHMGYLDNTFFAYTLGAYGNGIDIEQPETVVDHYIDNVYFKVESIEKDMVNMNETYRGYKRALDSVKAMSGNRK